MSGVIRTVAGIALMFVGIFSGNLYLAKAGYYLAMSGLVEEVSKLFMPKPPKQQMRQDVEYVGTTEARRIIYGRGRVGGMNTIRAIVNGDEGKLLWGILTIAGHRVNAIPSVYFNQDEITNAQIAAVSGTTGDGLVTAGKYDGFAWIRRYLGTTTQTADYKLVNQGPSGFWTANHRGREVAYLALTWKLNQKLYGSGKPDVSALVEGKLVYDPRLDTSPGANPTSDTYKAYSNNPALCTADYLIDTALGRGVLPARVDWDLVVAAANICDELVAIPGSATQKRYTCFAVLEADADPRDNIKALASAMMGICYRTGGKWRMYAGADGTPSFALTASNIIGKYTFRTETPQGEKYNYVRGTFRDATRNWLEVEYEPRSNAAYETADGLRLPTEAPFLTCTDQWEAQRNSIIVSRRGRMARTLTATFDLAAFKVRPWDVGTMTLAEVGWNAQRVVCMAWDFQGDGSIQVVLQEDDATIWDDPAVGQYITPGAGTSGTSQAYTPDPPSNLTATSLAGAIEFGWTPPIATLAGDVIQLYEHTASTPFSSATKIWEGAASSVVIGKSDQTTRYYWALTYAPSSENASSTAPAVTGVAGAALPPPADGADALSVSLSLYALNIQCDSAGVPVSGAFTNAVGQVTVFSGASDVTASATYSSTTSNVTGSVNTATNTPVTGAKGSYRITELAANSGYLEMTVVYGSQTIIQRFTVQKAIAGAASVSATDTSWASITETSYSPGTEAAYVTIAVGPNGTIAVSAALRFTTTTTSEITITMKIQYREEGGTWTDVTGASGSGTSIYEPPAQADLISIPSNTSITPPTTPKIYQFRVLAYKSGTTYSTQISTFSASWSP